MYFDAQGIADSTAFVVTAKHGQSPKKPSLLKLMASSVIDKVLTDANITVAQHTSDDVSLIWLADPTQAAQAAKILMAGGADLGIAQVYYGAELQTMGIAGVSPTDPHAPDLVTKVVPGVV